MSYAETLGPNNNLAASEQQMSQTVCRYFLNGNNCRYGTHCRYLHPESVDASENGEVETTTLIDGNTSSAMLQKNASNHIPLASYLSVDAPEFVPSNFSSSQSTATATTTTTSTAVPDDNVPEEVEAPPTISYAQIVSGNPSTTANVFEHIEIISNPLAGSTLCPYLNRIATADGLMCPYGTTCIYLHGDLCDICGEYCLHPTDETQRRDHQSKCMVLFEKDMQLSFAVAKSKDKTCGICFEVITEKMNREHRFGILPNCMHIFCLQCIRKWRQAKNFDSTITRACPECRVTSNYVCPSLYWVDTKEEKEMLLSAYKGALGQQNCKYFNKGLGTCKFGNKCFYAHRLADGTLVDVGEPHQRRRLDLNGESDMYQHLLLWNFLEVRDNISSDDDFQSFISNNSDLGIV